MKTIVLIYALFLFSCSPNTQVQPVPGTDTIDGTVKYTDTVPDPGPSIEINDTTGKKYDLLIMALRHGIDSLKTQLFLANYKIQKVKFYLSITDRKPSQVKFLRGWIRRAIQ